jgi:diketogulonate reductase-like aldo/keto reductase
MVPRQQCAISVSHLFSSSGYHMIDIIRRSFWTLTGSPSLLSHPATASFAKENKCTPPQAVYRFAQSLGITPLSGTTDENHMREDLVAESLNQGEEFFGTLTRFIWR